MTPLGTALAALVIPVAMYSAPSDHWQLLRDRYGDAQAAVDLDSIHKREPGLTLALVKDKQGREGYFATDCGQFLLLLHPRNMDDLQYQLDHLPQVFASYREHVHPDSLGAAIVKAVCAKG